MSPAGRTRWSRPATSPVVRSRACSSRPATGVRPHATRSYGRQRSCGPRRRTCAASRASSAPQWNAAHDAAWSTSTSRTVDDPAPIQAATAAVARDHPALDLREAGDVSVDDAVNTRVAEDLHSAEGISLPITILLMLLAFGALIAAGVPVLLAITSVAATMGIAAPLSHLIHAEPTVTSMIVLIGMAVGVDYSLFYLKREREERAKGHTTLDAVEIAAATSGHSILVSGAAVIGSMAGLFIVGGATFDSLASGAIVVVAVAVIGSVTVLPALLAKLGRWVDRPRLPLLWRLNRRIGQGGISRRLLAPVVRRPVAALLVALTALIPLAVPALGMKTHNANLDTLPATIPEVRTCTRSRTRSPPRAPRRRSSCTARRGGGPLPHRPAAPRGAAAATPWFAPAGPGAIETSADGDRAAHPADPLAAVGRRGRRGRAGPARPSWCRRPWTASPESTRWEATWRSPSTTRRTSRPASLRDRVRAAADPGDDGLGVPQHRVALLSSALNLLSVGVAFGILTLVFQRGWLAGPLGFTSPGFVIDWIPLFVLVVLVGLSMDYNVFVLARIREHAAHGLPARVAVRARHHRHRRRDHQRGRGDGLGVLDLHHPEHAGDEDDGRALAASILIDATVIRLVILPAALVLLGERAWWPGRLRRPYGEVVRARARAGAGAG